MPAVTASLQSTWYVLRKQRQQDIFLGRLGLFGWGGRTSAQEGTGDHFKLPGYIQNEV